MILVLVQDAGPAQYLVYIKSMALPKQLVWKAESEGKKVIEENGIVVSDASLEALEPTLIITGTSLNKSPRSLEKSAIIYAQENMIPCVSVIEHWTWPLERFTLEDGSVLMPSMIFVNDEMMREKCERQGIPKSKLVVTGNPHIESLCNHRMQPTVNLNGKEKKILFISEGISDTIVDGSLPDLGYDEFMVLERLTKALPNEIRLEIKVHPAENDEKYSEYISEKVSITKEADKCQIANKYLMIVGMDSMLLIELAILGANVWSYRPNAVSDFVGVEIGLVGKMLTTAELANYCYSGNSHHLQRNGNDAFIGSFARIEKILAGLAGQ